jgi:hypothetical protein
MWSSDRVRNAPTTSSRPAQIRETSDLLILGPAPRASTRSAERVETPWTQASITTAYMAWSMLRRGSNIEGKSDPFLSFGIRGSSAGLGGQRPVPTTVALGDPFRGALVATGAERLEHLRHGTLG